MRPLVGLLIVLLCACAKEPSHASLVDDWSYYGRDPGGTRFSPLGDINRNNVARLTSAWVFHTGQTSAGRGRRVGFESTPIVVDGTLYVTTGTNRIIAIDPETGIARWQYDPKIDLDANYGDRLINRGVATWLDTRVQSGAPCHRRLFEATLDARLVAVDAATGSSCADFGTNGEVNLKGVPGYQPGVYHMTSPPAIIDDLVVVGSAINDNERVDEPSGIVRAFDARSGALRWSWDPIRAGVEGAARTSGAANAWSPMAVDPERHLVFVPTGSASPDYYGALRVGDNKWANSVVALRAQSGDVAWAFQLVHHDLWDYDTASSPLLTTITRDGQQIPAVIQTNKTGLLFVLRRDNGEPIFPIEERPVPQSDLPGEHASPTQPVPRTMPALTPQSLSDTDIWGATPADLMACRNTIAGLRNEGIFTPPSIKGTLVIPGNVGGPNWSGYAFDTERQLLIVNTNNLPAIAQLIPRHEFDTMPRRNDGEYGLSVGAPYVLFRRYAQAPSGLPCSKPPWGSLTAVDLTNATIRWNVPLGSMASFARDVQGVPAGSISLGGPIVTAGGLVFVAGTIDPYLRAFDVETGRELWKAQLPASGHATPMTYRSVSGRQFVVIAAGGHAKIDEEPVGDALVAFALPR